MDKVKNNNNNNNNNNNTKRDQSIDSKTTTATSTSTVTTKRKQKRLGPAPIASFEDSSDEIRSKMDSGSSPENRLPDIREHETPKKKLLSKTTTTTTTTAALNIDDINDNVAASSSSSSVSAEHSIISTISIADNLKMLTTTTTTTTANTAAAAAAAAASSSTDNILDSNNSTDNIENTTGNSGTDGGGGGGVGGTSVTSINLGVHIPTTPRIDISRASSSSHHDDSRESSPDNVFDQVGTGTLQETAALGFREDGALDLRSSTEELYFMEPEKLNQDKCNNQNQPQQNQQAQQQQQQITTRRSPILFKIDDQQLQQQQHQACLQQNQRKDSASSEVAALLCISGRTSRVSSVGSQGSAFSRLSAMSGISRSPSPHKMLLETSFCGPKPVVENMIAGGIDNNLEISSSDILEQVILSRKHDPTKAIFAEGIHLINHHHHHHQSPKHAGQPPPTDGTTNNNEHHKTIIANGNNIIIVDNIDGCNQQLNVQKSMVNPSVQQHQKNVNSEISIALAAAGKKSKGVLKPSANKPIMGKTDSGIDYIRIKLKPDHLYNDKGIGKNEYIMDDGTTKVVDHSAIKKPDTLSLGQGTPSKKAAPHFSQLVKTDNNSNNNSNNNNNNKLLNSGSSCAPSKSDRLTPNASPKPTRHPTMLRDVSSRSPSPATITNVSRKSSFCSLFKSTNKDSPDSPNASGQRKKSGISVLLNNDSPRDRSRSKSRDSDGNDRQTPTTAIINPTPNKQKSVLAIFKPKKGGGGGSNNISKSNSPIDPAMMNNTVEHDAALQTYGDSNSSRTTTPHRLRYYDEPLDGNSIYIPLHTPPEEKENSTVKQWETNVDDERNRCPLKNHESSLNMVVGVDKSARNGNETADVQQIATTQIITTAIVQSIPAYKTATINNNDKTTPTRAVATSKIIEPPHSTTKRSYSSQNMKKENSDGSIRIPLKSPSDDQLGVFTENEDSLWSMEAQRNSSVESQETVISSRIPSIASIENLQQNSISRKSSKINILEGKELTIIGSGIENSSDTQLQTVSQSSITTATTTTTTTQSPCTNNYSSNKESEECPSTRDKSVNTASQSIVTTTGSNVTTTSNTTTAPLTTKEKKRILFCTKIGSGSEEQIFSTQLSLSKTESLSSQLSEHASALDSPNGIEETNESINNNNNNNNSNNNNSSALKTKGNFDVAMKRTRSRISNDIPEDDGDQLEKNKFTKNINRNSMYIENIDDILEQQRKLDIINRKTKPILEIPAPPPPPPTTTSTTTTTASSSPSTSIDATYAHSSKMTHQHSVIIEPSSPPPIVVGVTKKSTTHVSPSNIDERYASSDSEMDPPTTVKNYPIDRRHHEFSAVEEECTGLVAQESFEDELPYIPTTLPEERSICISLVPIKERSLMDIKTCPVERPRSTTPLNPSFLEDYCGTASLTEDIIDPFDIRICDKIRISLPRRNSRGTTTIPVDLDCTTGSGIMTITNNSITLTDNQNYEKVTSKKSPRRTSNTSGKSWFEFAEQGIASGHGIQQQTHERRDSTQDCDESLDESQIPLSLSSSPPPPLPPRKSSQNTLQWINFENIPEKRKQPKRIQTLPHKEPIVQSTASTPPFPLPLRSSGSNIHYVNPDECKCDCHDAFKEMSTTTTTTGTGSADRGNCLVTDDNLTIIDKEQQPLAARPDDTVPLLENDSEGITSISDSSLDEPNTNTIQRKPNKGNKDKIITESGGSSSSGGGGNSIKQSTPPRHHDKSISKHK